MDSKRQLSNCSQCGALFIRSLKEICPKCDLDNSEKINIIHSYLQNEENSSIHSAAIKADISYNSALSLLNNSKFWSYKDLKPPCRICGQTINNFNGKLICNSCQCKLSSGSQSTEKIDQLRYCLKYRANIELENTKNNILNTNNNKEKQVSKAFEVELLPDVGENTLFRLSNKFKLVNAFGY